MHNKMFMLLGLVISVVWGLSSSSFYMFWCSLEFNTMWFLGILWFEEEGGNLMKYFLIQGLGSLMLVWGIFGPISSLLVLGSLMKLGVFPFHMWSLELVEKVTWFIWLTLMSVQKILPIVLLMSVSGLSFELMIIVVMNLFISCVGSYHKSGLKTLLFYSSLFNMSLMLLFVDSMGGMLVMFFLYSLTLIPSWSLVSNLGSVSVQELDLDSGMLLMYLSLGGFPPTVGFLFKWGAFSYLTMAGYSFYLLSICILASLYMFYIYLMIILQSMMNSFSLGAGMDWKGGTQGLTGQVFLPMVILTMM